MALNSLGLGFVFTAQDMATGKINSIARSFGNMDNAAVRSSANMQRNFAQLGAGALVLGSGVGALAGSFALANQASEFTQGVARMGQISRASAADLQLLRDRAIQAGIETQFSPQEAVEGLTNLAQAGMNAGQSMQALGGVLAFAAGGQVEVGSASAAVSAALRVFRLDADQAGLVADQFLRITNSTALAAGDMEQAMGSVARGAIATSQSIEEMLPAIGLVKNTGVDVSVAAQSVSSALVFMSSRAAAFDAIGVKVTNADGSFRPFLDIVRETAVELEERYPNAAERASKATDLFSRFGLQAYTGVSQQLAQGVRDAAGNLYQGADAVAYLRGEMANAAGTADEFTRALNDTFEGRKTLLRGSMQTLGVLLGEGFEAALKPMIEAVTDSINFVLGILNEMPIELRTLIAHFVLGFGAVASFFGAFIAGKAIIALLVPFVGSLTTAFVGLLATLAPVALAFGAIIAIGYAFNRFVSSNEQRLATWTGLIDRVKLGFRGLMQLISTGGLSGGVLAELNRAENSGLKRFIGNIYAFGFRIMQFFRGIGIGFNAAIDAMGPNFIRLTRAFSRLWGYVSMIFGGGASLVEGGSMRYVTAGSRIGDFLGSLVGVFVDVAAAATRFATGFIGGFRAVWHWAGPTIDFAVAQFGVLWDTLVDVGKDLGLVSENVGGNGTAFEGLGQAIGGFVAGPLTFLIGALGTVARILREVIRVVMFFVNVAKWLFKAFFNIGVSIGQLMMNVKFNVMDVIDTAIVKIGELMSAIPAGMRPAFADSAIVAGGLAQGRLAQRTVQRAQINSLAENTRFDLSHFSDSPSTAQQRVNAEGANAQVQASLAAAQLIIRQAQQRQQGTQTINLVVDGQQIATATASANANSQERTFSPTGGGD